ncbi:MAG: hypothetical protein KAX24_12125, partial [Anaerolineae bacterium]|nr:hypothetical protein [Anaerolineae bacterium]
TLTNAQELEFEFEEPRPSIPGRGRRILVIVMGMIVAGVVLSIIGLTFAQGSWWYTYGTDQALDHETRARVEAIRDEVDAGGSAPEAVVWLNAALDPNAHPTDIRTYLLAAQEALKATGDPKLAEAAEELQAIIQMIRPVPLWETTTPRPVSTLEWPW